MRLQERKKENISNEIKFKLAKNVAQGATCERGYGGRGMIMSLLKMSSGNNNNNN